ncbi:uncharacterized protein KQ657_000428 [Scheffersomyces spartinae]|uniref:Uncharacterized protein n=1 Tax=Scheffersomyces spartinae TaxID=45513 RepID=A0A9P8AHU6_9ASCO|nr:uncharacterized protein KQ657_000428 [Scheffersomyces spartinae]KAG7193737.1 hypothetical protein KQ657_000428 [Scheffersomyces spartinae]
MGYPKELKAITRKLTDNIVISSTAFSRKDVLNIGARMALFNYNGGVVVWSALPYGEVVTDALNTLGNTKVEYLIVPDKEHTMAVKSFQNVYPNLKVIGMENINVHADYVVTSKDSDKLIGKAELEGLGIKDSIILDNFEFVYLPYHVNQELVMFDKNSQILFEADLLFNMQDSMEQYSPGTGYSENFYPHSGLSFLTRYMQPYSKVGNKMTGIVAKPDKNAVGLRQIYDWNFHTIVMCHGNILNKGAKEAFKNAFSSVIQ